MLKNVAQLFKKQIYKPGKFGLSLIDMLTCEGRELKFQLAHMALNVLEQTRYIFELPILR